VATADEIRRQSYIQSEEARERAARALADQIAIAQEGVGLAQAASDKSLAEIRAQAARGLASQFQAAGRRAAGGGTLAALGQVGRDTERAISAQQAQNDARIQAAKMAAADVEATKTMERSELLDRQRNAQEQFAAILAGMPDEDLIGKNMDRIRYLRAQRAQTEDPALIQMINQRIKVEEGGY
jgi:pyruvate/2-oxoglutarate dehydrogenase complex dihydrolipoamide acyltransferase (E2) component